MDSHRGTVTLVYLCMVSVVPAVVLAQGRGTEDPFARSTKIPKPKKFVGIDPSDTSTEYLKYEIPKTAIRKGPFMVRWPRHAGEYRYTDPKTGNQVANELVSIPKDGKPLVIRRDLFKNSMRHGIQKEWYSNAQLKSAIPYKNGIMHGECKHYDEDGRLVGWYRIQNGHGVKRIYYSNGRLKRLLRYHDNQRNGPSFHFHENGQISGIAYMKSDTFTGKSISFWPDGRTQAITWSNRRGLHGPLYTQYTDPKLKLPAKVLYYLNGNPVSPKDYATASKADDALPPMYENTEKYLDFVDDKAKRLVAISKRLKAVKIPLEHPTVSIIASENK